MDKIFYSWQSDSPNATNRGFIEDVLQKAIRNLGQSDDELYEPSREIELDKDTKGVPGTPPIADTIFEKIEQCSVFVPDLTFIAETEKGRYCPNPNVLIEYGWALAKCGYGRIVGVINTAYGKVNETSLPFDIRHHTWPIMYNLPQDADQDTRAEVKKDLVKVLTGRIGEILRNIPSEKQSTSYTPIPHKSRVSSFLDEGDVLCRHNPWGERQKAIEIIWNDGPQIFLRLIPEQAAERKSPVELKKQAEAAVMMPFGRVSGSWSAGNEWGFVVFEAKNVENQNTANRILQIGSYGELWGIDGFSLRDAEAVPFDERGYAVVLAKYMKFVCQNLGVTSPVHVIAGFSGVAGMKIWAPPLSAGYRYNNFEHKWGNAVVDDIVGDVTGVSLELPSEVSLEKGEECAYDLQDPWVAYAYKTLVPVFNTIWEYF